MRKRRKKSREKQIYYGMALLVAVFIVVGLTTAVKGGAKKNIEVCKVQEVKPSDEKKADAADSGEKKKGKKEQKEQGSKTDNPDIRVLLMTNGFRDVTHSQVRLSAESGMVVTYGDKKKEYGKKKTLKLEPDHKWFKNGTVRIQAKKGRIKVKSLERGYGVPSYDGVIELRSTAEGIAMINELSVEDYLCAVVPSEMPASYELEALKAQAVCARSYAYRQMEEYGYPEYEAHVNDSTYYQVYNNSGQAESSSKAVGETAGQTVMYKGKIATTYY